MRRAAGGGVGEGLGGRVQLYLRKPMHSVSTCSIVGDSWMCCTGGQHLKEVLDG